jgi:hypothetical protein
MSWDRLHERLSWVVRSGEPARCRHILTVLALHAADDDGSCWVSVGTLAAETGVGTTTVRLAVSDMIRRGVIAVPDGRRGGGTHGGTRYVVPAFTRLPSRGGMNGESSPPLRPATPVHDTPAAVPLPSRGVNRQPYPRPSAPDRVIADATAVPGEIALDASLLAVAQEVGLTADQARRELEACLDWHRANGRSRVDWQATARNWLRKAAQIGQQRASAPSAPGPALPRPTDHGAWQTAADRYGLRARPGEDWPTFQARIRAFIERAAAQ